MPIEANYIDPNIEELYSTVQQKNSSVPFLLLPVRIETRFMEVSRPLFSGNQELLLSEIINILGKAELLLIKDFSTLSAAQKAERIKNSLKTIKSVLPKINSLKSLRKEQLNWLIDLNKSLKTHFAKIRSFIRRPDMKLISVGMQSLERSINSLKTDTSSKYIDMIKYIEELQNLEKTLHLLSQNKIPFNKPKNKKRLYLFIERLIENVDQFYTLNSKNVYEINFIEKNQTVKIGKLHEKVKNHMLKLPTYIKSVHKDNSWVAFVDTHAHLIKKDFPVKFQEFELEVLPKIAQIKDQKLVDANHYLIQSLKVKKALMEFNASKQPNFKKVKSLKKRLNKHLNKLENYKKKTLSGNPSQKIIIAESWQEIDNEVALFQDKIKQVPTKNKSQKFGIKESIAFVTKVSKNKELNFNLNNAISITDHKTLAQGFKLTNSGLKNIFGINSRLNLNKVVTKKELKSIEKIDKDIQLAIRKKMNFTASEISSLQNQVDSLESKISNTNFESRLIARSYAKTLENLRLRLNGIDDENIVANRDSGLEIISPSKMVNELWVRIYPDDVFVQNHEKQLTKDEIRNGKRYWKTLWAIGDNEGLKLGAWRSICSSHGSKRSAWILKITGQAKKAKNNHVKINSPSDTILKNHRLLEDVHSLLQSKKEEGFDSYIKSLEFIRETNTFVSIVSNYEAIQNKPQLVYYVERALSLKQRIASDLKIIAAFAETSELSNNPNISNQLHVFFNAFNKVQESFSKLTALRSDQFVDSLGEPYRYKETASLKPKENDWTVAAHTRVLPKQFVVFAKNNKQFEFLQMGSLIPEEIQLGLNPESFNFESEGDNPFQLDAHGDLKVDEGMKWMVDFDAAVEKGMGIKVPLSPSQAKKGFDELYVLGVNDQNAAKDTAELKELLENHHYAADGMSFLKIGTPTNNTEDVKSGFTDQDLEPELTQKIELQAPLFEAVLGNSKIEKADGQVLAEALGIESSHFQHIQNSELKQIGNARAMHQSLWHGTMGVYLEDMWDKVFTYDNIYRTKQFFTSHVIGRGSLPSIRIGSQPYGILPTTSFSRLSFSNIFKEDKLPKLTLSQLENPSQVAAQSKLQFRYDVRLRNLLLQCNQYWSDLRKSHVKHAGNMEQSEDPQADFINMLGLNATSTVYHFRYGVNVNDRTSNDLAGTVINIQDEVTWSPAEIRSKFSKFLNEGYFHPSFSFFDEQNPDSDPLFTALNSRVRDQFLKSRIFTYRYLNRHSTITGEWVTDGAKDVLPAVGEAENYIAWLLDRDKHVYLDIFNKNNIDELPSKSILFLLLRQSLLLSYREGALNILQKDGFFTESFRRLLGSKESYMSYKFWRPGAFPRFRTKWNGLLSRLSDINDEFFFDLSDSTGQSIADKPLFQHLKNGLGNQRNESLSDYIQNQQLFDSSPRKNAHLPFIQEIEKTRGSMELLQHINPNELGHLLSEHLDLCSYRLDAWIFGFANRRLEESRAKQEKGIFLGAYGWVENLKPGGERKEVIHPPTNMVSDSETIYRDEDNEGFIHAPSINHAITAAVLRSGYLANDDSTGNIKNQMAVNLSSSRVRKALYLISGLRNGLEISSLLGFQFERGLHERYSEAELDQFILPLRTRFPLITPIQVSVEETANDPHGNVINGLELLESITDEFDSDEADQMSLFEYLIQNNFEHTPQWLKQMVNSSTLVLSERNTSLKAILKEIDEMADTFDALGDLAVSESIYQIVNGNHVRASAMLTSLGNGSLIPEPEIIKTPRSGKVVTHRVLLHIEPTAGIPAGWNASPSARAKAEPALNNWIAKQIGNPANIRTILRNTENGQEFELSLKELPLQAIDVLFLQSANKNEGNLDLRDLMIQTIRSRESIDAGVGLNVQYTERDSHWDEGVRNFHELELMILELKTMLHEAKPMGYSDLSLPEDEPDIDNPDKVNIGVFQARINQILGDAKEFRNLLEDFINGHPALTVRSHLITAKNLLIKGLSYGITNLLADLKFDMSESMSEIILSRLIKAHELIDKRILEASQHQNNMSSVHASYLKVEKMISIVKAIFGNNFTILPEFACDNTSDINDQLNLEDTKALLRNSTSTFPMEEWLHGISDVRTKMQALEMIRLIKGTFEISVKRIQPVQFPFEEDDYWLGIAHPESYDPDDKLSLILVNPELAGNTNQTGIVLDEWVEIIPGPKQTTGVSFQYDQPDNTPPQTILLAVSPKPITNTSKWELEDLVYTLTDTFELARNRTVEPDHLEDSMFGQILPGIISEVVPPQTRVDDQSDGDNHDNLLGVQVVLDYANNLKEEKNNE